MRSVRETGRNIRRTRQPLFAADGVLDRVPVVTRGEVLGVGDEVPDAPEPDRRHRRRGGLAVRCRPGVAAVEPDVAEPVPEQLPRPLLGLHTGQIAHRFRGGGEFGQVLEMSGGQRDQPEASGAHNGLGHQANAPGSADGGKRPGSRALRPAAGSREARCRSCRSAVPSGRMARPHGEMAPSAGPAPHGKAPRQPDPPRTGRRPVRRTRPARGGGPVRRTRAPHGKTPPQPDPPSHGETPPSAGPAPRRSLLPLPHRFRQLSGRSSSAPRSVYVKKLY
ncbi:hypothetical protein SAMN05421854_10510 [Amycolatopsis rubida]|uniref:Uncharacterized protein n=1 Tax=Amycolatopsis rubida TaxID=112413 RepID=A0A1I5PLH7_9PSEU|nr:hypothetical protein SAMN05421854_10510 [Amycolatopsis rubida]